MPRKETHVHRVPAGRAKLGGEVPRQQPLGCRCPQPVEGHPRAAPGACPRRAASRRDGQRGRGEGPGDCQGAQEKQCPAHVGSDLV